MIDGSSEADCLKKKKQARGLNRKILKKKNGLEIGDRRKRWFKKMIASE